MKKRLLMFCILYVVWSVNIFAVELPAPSFKTWIIRCDQTIQQLEDILSKTDQQQHMNYSIANLCFLYDVKLNYVFQHYLELLITTEQKDKSMDEQAAWLENRKVIFERIYNSYNGGTGGPYTSGLRYIKLTKQRIEVLNLKIVGKQAQI